MNKIPAMQTRARSYFDEGELAFQDGENRDECPYPWESSAAANWLAGWDAADYENARMSNDDAYNDPRHGQARELNRGNR